MNIEFEDETIETTTEDVVLKEKEEKRLKERQEILNGAVSGSISNIREKVAFILNNVIASRNSDIELAWLFWDTFEKEIFNGSYVTKKDLFNLTKISSLTRIRAKIQNEYKLFQADDTVKKHRGVLEAEKRQEAIEDRPHYPLYSIYIDETGKTQQYITVGSLWLTDPMTALLAGFELRDWIKENNIDFEFHFKEVTQNCLEKYKEFFLKFLILHPSAGFKAIIIKKAGISNINIGITDLTFHLINKGIDHENSTGRAPLPRLLQVVIDNEESGSDKLKIENIKERITSQKITGLHIDSIEVADSKGNFYLQIVDLFTSSINRKIHNPESKENAKDLLAEYILGLVNFNIELVDKENNNLDNSAVFNLTYDR